VKKVALALIRFYQLAISPHRPNSCRYIPSCSEYGYEAIEKFGALKGGLLTLKRICSCHPLAKGGADPVP